MSICQSVSLSLCHLILCLCLLSTSCSPSLSEHASASLLPIFPALFPLLSISYSYPFLSALSPFHSLFRVSFLLEPSERDDDIPVDWNDCCLPMTGWMQGRQDERSTDNKGDMREAKGDFSFFLQLWTPNGDMKEKRKEIKVNVDIMRSRKRRGTTKKTAEIYKKNGWSCLERQREKWQKEYLEPGEFRDLWISLRKYIQIMYIGLDYLQIAYRKACIASHFYTAI